MIVRPLHGLLLLALAVTLSSSTYNFRHPALTLRGTPSATDLERTPPAYHPGQHVITKRQVPGAFFPGFFSGFGGQSRFIVPRGGRFRGIRSQGSLGRLGLGHPVAVYRGKGRRRLFRGRGRSLLNYVGGTASVGGHVFG